MYFLIQKGDNTLEIWKSNGNATGTILVKSFNVSSVSFGSYGLTDVNGVLFFIMNDGSSGMELWKTNGTTAGTVMVKDIVVGSGSSSPANLLNVNGVLFFTAYTIANGDELWKSDGTSAGTVMVKDINVGQGHSQPQSLTNVNGTLFFNATNGANGYELWKSNGTAAGTVMVKDIKAGTGSSFPSSLYNFNGTVYFSAYDASGITRGLWKSDGTAAGTVLVHLLDEHRFASPERFTNVNGTLFFTAQTYEPSWKLWKTDGTPQGTVVAQEVQTGISEPLPAYLTNVNNILIFQGADNNVGWELWSSNGSCTQFIQDFDAGSASGSPSDFVVIGTKVFCSAIGQLMVADVAAMTANPTTPSISITRSVSDSVIIGTNVIFTASYNNAGTRPLFQWEKNGINVGISRALYADTDLNNGDSVRCVITSNSTCFTVDNATSNSITVLVKRIQLNWTGNAGDSLLTNKKNWKPSVAPTLVDTLVFSAARHANIKWPSTDVYIGDTVSVNTGSTRFRQLQVKGNVSFYGASTSKLYTYGLSGKVIVEDGGTLSLPPQTEFLPSRKDLLATANLSVINKGSIECGKFLISRGWAEIQGGTLKATEVSNMQDGRLVINGSLHSVTNLSLNAGSNTTITNLGLVNQIQPFSFKVSVDAVVNDSIKVNLHTTNNGINLELPRRTIYGNITINSSNTTDALSLYGSDTTFYKGTILFLKKGTLNFNTLFSLDGNIIHMGVGDTATVGTTPILVDGTEQFKATVLNLPLIITGNTDSEIKWPIGLSFPKLVINKSSLANKIVFTSPLAVVGTSGITECRIFQGELNVKAVPGLNKTMVLENANLIIDANGKLTVEEQ